MDKTLVLAVLALWLVCDVSYLIEACSCQFLHPHVHFCNADYVIKGRVRKETKVYNDRNFLISLNYTVAIERIFKGNDALKNATQTTIYTPSSGSMCGTGLKKRHKYLLMGRKVGDQLTITICDNVQSWSDVTKTQRRALKKRYADSCDCKVEICRAPKCQKKRDLSRNTCRWNPREDPGFCFSQHSFCKRRPNGKCKWSANKAMKKCITEVEEERRKEP